MISRTLSLFSLIGTTLYTLLILLSYVGWATPMLVLGIAADGNLDCHAVGAGGSQSEQYRRYLYLCQTAASWELEALTGHSNSVVRCYAFEALVRRSSTAIYSILLDHLDDTASTSGRCGCTGNGGPVVKHFLSSADPRNRWPGDPTPLSAVQQRHIDSILLFDPRMREIWNRRSMLERLQPVPEFYERVRALATSETEDAPEAIVPLARYRKAEDTAPVKDALLDSYRFRYGLKVVLEFPDSIYYEPLVAGFERQLVAASSDRTWGMQPILNALARYPREQTRMLFGKLIDTTGEYDALRLESMMAAAIVRYPHREWDPLYREVDLDDEQRTEIRSEMHYPAYSY